MALLDKIIQVLPQAQRLAIKSLLASKKKASEIKTAREELAAAEQLYKNLQSKLGGQLFTSPRYAISDNKISSADHNNNMEEIYIDLNAIYGQIDALGKSESSKAAALQSDYFKSRAAIEKLINDARTFALRKKYNKFTEINVIDFNSARNITNQIPKAIIDDNTRLLELTAINTVPAHLANRGVRITRVYTKTISPGIKANLSVEFPPEGMIDQKPETFWLTSILSDVPINQKFDGANIYGPIVEVYLSYSHVEMLNVFRMLPFGEFPIKLLNISYKPNPSSEVYYDIPFTDEEATLDWIEVNFPTIYASELKITIAQENPKQVIYHLPRSLVNNTDVFNYIVREQTDRNFKSQFFDSDLANELRRATSAYEGALKDLESIISSASLEKTRYTEVDLNNDLLNSLGLVFDQYDPEQLGLLNTYKEEKSFDKVIEIKKYEYILGIREVETSYEIYAPTCYFESEEYLPQATLSEVQIEVDERHLSLTNPWGTYYPTSTEWSVDIGEGRVIPIHPINKTGEFGYPAAIDERLDIDRNSNIGYTRLGCSKGNVLNLKKNGIPLPFTGYTQERQTQGTPRIKVTLADGFFDENSIYTVDYEVVLDSYNIDILNNFESRSLTTPESYSSLGPDNDIVLKRYPYIEYEIVNRTGQFTAETGVAKWTYIPPTGNLLTGHIKIYPTILTNIGEAIYTGNITGFTVSGSWGARSGQPFLNLTNLNNNFFNDPFGYYLQVQDVKRSFEVSGTFSTTGFTLYSPTQFTINEILQMPEAALTGMYLTNLSSPSGYLLAEYAIGVGINIRNNIFAFDNSIYEPIKVTVGGKEAKNITDYKTLQHPAFSVATNQDNQYQYIHAGRRLYFNQPIDNEIKVDYDWLTEYIKVLGTLRCNTPINPNFTPKVNTIKVLMNTSTI